MQDNVSCDFREYMLGGQRLKRWGLAKNEFLPLYMIWLLAFITCRWNLTKFVEQATPPLYFALEICALCV